MPRPSFLSAPLPPPPSPGIQRGKPSHQCSTSGFSRCFGLTFTLSNRLTRRSLQSHVKAPGPEMLFRPLSCAQRGAERRESRERPQQGRPKKRRPGLGPRNRNGKGTWASSLSWKVKRCSGPGGRRLGVRGVSGWKSIPPGGCSLWSQGRRAAGRQLVHTKPRVRGPCRRPAQPARVARVHCNPCKQGCGEEGFQKLNPLFLLIRPAPPEFAQRRTFREAPLPAQPEAPRT